MIKSGFITSIQIILSILNFSVLGFDHTTRGFAQVRTDHWANQAPERVAQN
jgi:hypothetical protein